MRMTSLDSCTLLLVPQVQTPYWRQLTLVTSWLLTQEQKGEIFYVTCMFAFILQYIIPHVFVGYTVTAGIK